MIPKAGPSQRKNVITKRSKVHPSRETDSSLSLPSSWNPSRRYYPAKEDVKLFKKRNPACAQKKSEIKPVYTYRYRNNLGHFDYWYLRDKDKQTGPPWDQDYLSSSYTPTDHGHDAKKVLTEKEERELKRQQDKEVLKRLKERGVGWRVRFLVWLSQGAGMAGGCLIHLLLILLLTLYTLLGGYIFHLIEGNDDELDYKQSFELRDELMSNISKTKGNDVEEELNTYFQTYEQSILSNINNNAKMDRGKHELNWDFWSSVFFCFTVYTTIGYGHMSPVTLAGRIIVIPYAIIGIPLFLILLTDFGKGLTRILKVIWSCLRNLYYSKVFQKGKVKFQQTASKMANEDPNNPDIKMSEKPEEAFRIDDQFNVPVPIAILILIIYLIIGAIVFTKWEGWSYIDSFYFVFGSIATIGFGDFVPMKLEELLLCIVFLVVGLSLTTMCINVVREALVKYLVTTTAAVGEHYGLDIELDQKILGKDSKAKADEDEEEGPQGKR